MSRFYTTNLGGITVQTLKTSQAIANCKYAAIDTKIYFSANYIRLRGQCEYVNFITSRFPSSDTTFFYFYTSKNKQILMEWALETAVLISGTLHECCCCEIRPNSAQTMTIHVRGGADKNTYPTHTLQRSKSQFPSANGHFFPLKNI